MKCPSIVLLSLASAISAAPAAQIFTRAPAGAPTGLTKNGTYYGTYSTEYNQDFFLGIPFAHPPLDDLRFKNPKPLNSKWDGALPATTYSQECVGYGSDQIGYQQGEDCLYLNIVRPHGYENDSSLPVAVWIHGGGLEMGGAVDRRYNLSFVVEKSVEIGRPIIAASIAYRLGPFGFLYSDEVAKSGQTNIGFRDQRLALHWINENIAGFGGDPTRVTIWGESAGGSSVGLHLLAYNGRDDKIFRAAIMESGNPIFEGPLNGSSWYQPRFDALVEAAGCGKTDFLACLRNLPFTVLNSILNSTDFSTSWNPTIDGDTFTKLGSEQLATGQFVHVPIISGATTDEGTAFSPIGIDTTEDFSYWLTTTTSAELALPETLVTKLLAAYPADNSNGIPSLEELGGNVTLGVPWGSMYRRSAAYFGDEVFIAARRLTCETWASAGVNAYCYRFNAIPSGIPWPIEVTHFSEVAFVFNNLNGVGYATNPFEGKGDSYTQLSDLMSASWASFVAELDPNGWSGRNTSVPRWPVYDVKNPLNMVWDANVTSYTEPDTFRGEGIKLLNDNWKYFLR